MSVDLAAADLLSVASTDFRFLRPLWLLGLLAIPLLLWWLRRLRQRRDVWRDVVDAHLLSHLLQGRQTARGGWRNIAPVLAWTLAILALAGPSWRELPQPLWQDRNPLVIALDLSYATLTADVQPTRLLQARAKIAHILRTRGGGQIALVAFADDAYTVSPLTDDADNIALFLDALTPDVMPRDGSRTDRAIEESMRLLTRTGFKRGDILLITDHAGGAAGSAAIDARKAGYRVSVLGLGTPAGGAYRQAKGGVGSARLEEDALRRIASVGGGSYATVAPGDEDLRALGVLQADRIDAAAAQGKRGTAPLDEGFWLLPALLMLALLAFRRGVLAVALLALYLPWQPAFAADGSLWQREDQRQYAQMRRGVEAYRSGDYAAAETALRDLPGAEAAYNRGNTLAKQGRYDEAIAEYDRALTLQPSMRDAVENRQRVEAARKRKPPQDPKQKPPQKPKDKPKDPAQDKPQDKPQDPPKDKPQDQQQDQPQNQPQDKPQDKPQENPQDKPQDSPKNGQQNPAPGKQGQPQPPQNASQNPQPAKPQPQKPDPADRKAQEQAQREADAAQRERMRQAKPPEKKGPGDAPKKPPQTLPGTSTGGPVPAKESAQARERRIANQVALQRVPDDPGGLLRAKFKLEQQRRRRGGDR
ncbi:MAG: VWA domain-containing protein [Lysobacter sp.]|nr:VWA domain-containing protein [Lysobacter sp.]